MTTTSMQLRCPYCHTALAAGSEQPCRVCRTPHHADCLAENGGCAVLGCAGAPAAQASAPAGPPDLQPVPIPGGYQQHPPPPAGYGSWAPAPAAPPPPPPVQPSYAAWTAGPPTPAPAAPVTPAPQPVPAVSRIPGEALRAHPLGIAGWYELDDGRLVYGVPWLFELPAPGTSPTRPTRPGSAR